MPLNTSINTPYLVLTGIILIAITFVFVTMQPMLTEISTLRHDITENTNTLQQKQDFINSLSAKVQLLQTQPDAEKQLSVVVPQNDETQDVLRVVGQYASATGVVVGGVTNNSQDRQSELDASIARGDITTAPSDMRTLSFQVQTISSYAQLREFMKALEKSPRIIDVAHVSVKKSDQSADQVSASLDMQAYSQQ